MKDVFINVAEIEGMKARWRVVSNAHLREGLRIVDEYPAAMREAIIEEGRRRFGADVPIGRAMPPELPVVYGGIERGGYISFAIGTHIVGTIVGDITGSSHLGACVAIVFTFVALIPLNFLRLRNIGISGYWALLTLIPVAGLFVVIPCLVFPEGYKHSRKLDLSAKVIIGFLIMLFVLGIIPVLVPS